MYLICKLKLCIQSSKSNVLKCLKTYCLVNFFSLMTITWYKGVLKKSLFFAFIDSINLSIYFVKLWYQISLYNDCSPDQKWVHILILMQMNLRNNCNWFEEYLMLTATTKFPSRLQLLIVCVIRLLALNVCLFYVYISRKLNDDVLCNSYSNKAHVFLTLSINKKRSWKPKRCNSLLLQNPLLKLK